MCFFTISYRVNKFIFRNQLTIDYNSSNNSNYGSFAQYYQTHVITEADGTIIASGDNVRGEKLGQKLEEFLK